MRRSSRSLPERSAGGGSGSLRFAVHFALLGALLYLAGTWLGVGGEGDAGTERPVVHVPESRLVQAREDFEARMHRQPSAAEAAEIRRTTVERDVLFHFALDLGLQEQATAQRRLAQIASFVGDDGPEVERDIGELARRAMELGLHRDDVVVRRILIDSAERLIRGAVLAREPSEESLREHLAAHADRFRSEERLQISYRSADAGGEIVTLPLLLERDLARRLGHDFLAAIDRRRLEAWQGPMTSYEGAVEARIERYVPAGPAPLDEVRDEVRAEVREVLAERWLEQRVEQLQDEYDVRIVRVVAEQPASGPAGEGR